jgi:hypothetical protein
MLEEYTKDQLWKLYEKLPADLKEAIFSEETADSIYSACAKYEIGKDKISGVAKYTGHVLLGLLPPAEFSKVLEAEIGIDKDTAQKIDHDINRFVFWLVKESLTALYSAEGDISSEARYKTVLAPPEETTETAVTKKEAPRKTRAKKNDIYREVIE